MRVAVVRELQQPRNHLDLAASDFQEHSHSPSITELLRRDVVLVGDNLLEAQDAGL